MTKLRKMTVAGQFYEKEPIQLELFFDSIITDSKKDLVPEKSVVRSVVAPHAGYIFSGKTAIRTIQTASKNSYKNIFIIAPSHYVGFKGLALSSFNEYETPLGNIEVNSDIVKNISGNNIQLFDKPHVHEHSLEVQLPIIKKIFPDTPIVPIICGQVDYSTSKQIAKSVLPYWKEENLWIISSDFTHYGSNFGYLPFNNNVKNNLRKLDLGAVDKILDLDPQGFYDYLNKTDATICGRHPISIMLNMASNNKNNQSLNTKLIEYITSGDLTGDFSHTVSYAGITIYK